MATYYWNYSSTAWVTADPGYKDGPKLGYWTDGGTGDATNDNNQALLSYRVRFDTSSHKMYLDFKVRSKNRTIEVSRGGWLCNCSLFESNAFKIYIKQGSTQLFSYVPANVADTIVSEDTLAKLPRLTQSTSWTYNTASTDGTTIKVPWSIEVTSYAGKSLTAFLRLAWTRYNTVSGVKYLERMNMTSLGEKTLCTLPVPSWQISYNGNATNTVSNLPGTQTKYAGTSLTLSDTTPTRASASAGSYTVTLNANGGSVSPASLTAVRTTSYTFKRWNTASDGSGTSYSPGNTYTANAAATMYAQWTGSTTTAAVTLPTPTRGGYTFLGWATSSTASSGITGSYTPTGNVTLFAIWKMNSKIYAGAEKMADGYIGTSQIKKIYFGTEVVFDTT